MSNARPIQTSNRLLAVIDSIDDARNAVLRLAEAGIGQDDVVLLHGDDGRARLPAGSGPWSRTMRLLSFMAVDQAVDLAWYAAAVDDGRTVLVIRTPGPQRRATTIAVLRGAGAHFINHYGRFATEDIAAWRGVPPEIPWTHRR